MWIWMFWRVGRTINSIVVNLIILSSVINGKRIKLTQDIEALISLFLSSMLFSGRSQWWVNFNYVLYQYICVTINKNNSFITSRVHYLKETSLRCVTIFLQTMQYRITKLLIKHRLWVFESIVVCLTFFSTFGLSTLWQRLNKTHWIS